jgi:hypothetical protein
MYNKSSLILLSIKSSYTNFKIILNKFPISSDCIENSKTNAEFSVH